MQIFLLRYIDQKTLWVTEEYDLYTKFDWDPYTTQVPSL